MARTRRLRIGTVAAVAAGTVLGFATPAAAEVVDPAGRGTRAASATAPPRSVSSFPVGRSTAR